MQPHISEGLVLHTQKFGDYDQILSVFTHHEGLLKMIVKGAYRKKHGIGKYVSAFTQAEFIYTKRQSSLLKCSEHTMLNAHLQIRKSLSCLECAFDMAKALLSSQLEQKPAPQLYELLICYLKRAPLSPFPKALACSFALKILRHEGLFGLGPYCSICQAKLSESGIAGGEIFCPAHSPAHAVLFDASETEAVLTLSLSRLFSEIEKHRVDPGLHAKILWLFNQAIKS